MVWTRYIGAASERERCGAWAAAWTPADLLHKCADVMVTGSEEAAWQITLKAGKPFAQSRREWQLSIDQLR